MIPCDANTNGLKYHYAADSTVLEVHGLWDLKTSQRGPTMFKRPFHSCKLSCQAFEWKWGWRWPWVLTIYGMSCRIFWANGTEVLFLSKEMDPTEPYHLILSSEMPCISSRKCCRRGPWHQVIAKWKFRKILLSNTSEGINFFPKKKK